MTVDEYEAIRLIDLSGLTQEECAGQMNISRTTVQGIYDEARKKLAESLVNGKILMIGGGEYQLCDGRGRGFPYKPILVPPRPLGQLGTRDERGGEDRRPRSAWRRA